jgi:hypothetical protein
MAEATRKTDGGTDETGGNPLRRRGAGAAATVKAGTAAVRNKVASLVWLVAVLCALFLAVGALLIALKANPDNAVVSLVVSVADWLDGPFSRENGIFTFADNADGRVKSALTNWGIAAVVYLVVGKILDRVIRP